MTEYLTTTTVGRAAKLTPMRVVQLANEGKIPVAAHAGRTRLFLPDDVATFLRSRTGGK